jgi:MoaA/NifB/PqqE/SkfB family radical SAM enzyme
MDLRPFCIAPFHALYIDPEGNVKPDNQFKGSLGNIKQSMLADILKNFAETRKTLAKKFSESHCKNCQSKERSGGHSRRIFFEDVVSPQVQHNNQEPRSEADLYYLEINTSNLCNLKCRMCDSSVSSSWAQEDTFLGSQLPHLERPKPYKRGLAEQDVERLFEQPEIFQSLRFLALRGGEPFLEPLNLKILEKVIELKLSQQITIDVSTNGTSVSERLMSLLRAFSKVQVYISLEGSGEMYQYIRGGSHFTLDQIESTVSVLRSLENLELIFTFTSMAYNLGQIRPVWDWYKGNRRPGDKISFSNLVVQPEYLNYQILPDALKKRYLVEIEQSDLLTSSEFTGIQSLVEGLKKSDYFKEDKKIRLQSQFREFNLWLDKKRGTQLRDVAPELSDFFEHTENFLKTPQPNL